MSNLNKDFWSKYYMENKDDIKQNSSFSEYIYENYVKQSNTDGNFLIADLGSGNCRDSIYFAENNTKCYSVDINGVLERNIENCQLIKEDVEIVLKYHKLGVKMDLIYMRWFLHAFPYENSNAIFHQAVKNLKSNGLICIEVRSMNDTYLKSISNYDEIDKSFKTTHKRWLYTIDMCKTLASDNNCNVIFCEEGYFSPNMKTETNNPLLIRCVFQKKII